MSRNPYKGDVLSGLARRGFKIRSVNSHSRSGIGLAFGVLLVGILEFYADIFGHSFNIVLVPREILFHIAANGACIIAAFIAAISSHGPVRRRLSRTFGVTTIAFGFLSLATLGGRLYFSRPMMACSFGVATFIGVIILWLRFRFEGGLRIAIAAPDGVQHGDALGLGEWIKDPTTDLRGFDIVLVTLTGDIPARWTQALSKAMLTGAQIRHVGEYVEETQGRVTVEHFDVDHISMFHLQSYRFGKRCLDVGFVLFLAPVVLPLLIVGMLAVRFCMGAPIFFVQDRVGLGGVVFRMFKLRTMSAASAATGQIATSKSDSRITRVGGILRRFRIDELPQLWNVLAGEMSLIGPRPEQPGLTDKYLKDLPAFAFRHLVRPGITGWAQVRAGYAADLAETRVKLSYDLFYIKYFSLLLDLQIVARTFWTLAAGGGVR